MMINWMGSRCAGRIGSVKMTGTTSQIEWAELIKPRVEAEFDRVANALNTAASHQTEQNRMDTMAVIAILKRNASK